MSKNHKFLGDIIKASRKKTRIPQWKLAEVADVDQSTISNFENGRIKTLKYDVALKICYFLDIDIRNIEGFVDREGEIDFIMALNQEMYERFLRCVKSVHTTIENADIENPNAVNDYPVERLTKMYLKEIFENSTQFSKEVILDKIRSFTEAK